MDKIYKCDESHALSFACLLLPLTTKHLFANMRLVLSHRKPHMILRLNDVILRHMLFMGNKWR
jgi:hypothetical protein